MTSQPPVLQNTFTHTHARTHIHTLRTHPQMCRHLGCTVTQAHTFTHTCTPRQGKCTCTDKTETNAMTYQSRTFAHMHTQTNTHTHTNRNSLLLVSKENQCNPKRGLCSKALLCSNAINLRETQLFRIRLEQWVSATKLFLRQEIPPYLSIQSQLIQQASKIRDHFHKHS